MDKLRQFLTVICQSHDNGGVLPFHALYSYGDFFQPCILIWFYQSSYIYFQRTVLPEVIKYCLKHPNLGIVKQGLRIVFNLLSIEPSQTSNDLSR